HRKLAGQTPRSSSLESSVCARHSGYQLDGDSAPLGGEAAGACRPPYKNSHRLVLFQAAVLQARKLNVRNEPKTDIGRQCLQWVGVGPHVRKGWKADIRFALMQS